jgi:hypothetical protein
VSRVVPLTAGQLALFEMSMKRRSRKARYRHVHTKEELAAFDRTLAVVARIPGGLEEDERWCPGLDVYGGAVVVGSVEVCARAGGSLLGAARLSRAGVRGGGAAPAVVGSSS